MLQYMYRRLDFRPLSCMATFSIDAQYDFWAVLELLDCLLAQVRRRGGLVEKKKRKKRRRKKKKKKKRIIIKVQNNVCAKGGKKSRLHKPYLNLTLVRQG